MTTEGGNVNDVLEELTSSLTEEGNESTDIAQTNPIQTNSEDDNNVTETDKTTTNEDGGGEEHDAGEEDDAQEVDEAEDLEEQEDEEVADTEAPDGEAEAPDGKADEENATIDSEQNSSENKELTSKAKEKQEEEEDAEETEENDKKMAEKFDPNQMPQVDVSILATRRWQVKVYPIRPSDFVSGQVSRVFKLAKESLLYLYTAGNNGRFSNGKAELYMSTISQAVKVMQNLMKLEFYHPETNIKIIRKNDSGAVIEKAYMRFDTKMASMLFQPRGLTRRVGNKRERIIGSVFLKNLPDGATKDMLRVMFPFAAEINFNPEKFKESTARLVLSNRNSVIPCLKAFSKVELGGNILELRPLEKRKRDDLPKKVPENDKTKEDGKSGSSSAKEEDKAAGKKEDTKSSTPGKEAAKKGATDESDNADQKDRRKPGPASKKFDTKQPRGGGAPGSHGDNRSGLAKKHPQGKFGPQRWQDNKQGSFSNQSRRGSRGGLHSATGSRFAGRGGSSFISPSRSRFAHGDGGFRSGGSPARGGGSGVVNAEVTKEMMQLQAQLSVAIKNQISMLNQTQLAVEQAKRGAAVSTAAAAAVIGASGAGRAGAGAGLGDYSRSGMNMNQGDQYSRASEQSRRSQIDSGNRQRAENRNRAVRDRRNSFGDRGSGRGNRASRTSNFGNKRNTARAGFDLDDSYEDVSYPKRTNFGSTGQSRSWAEETEDLDIYSNNKPGMSYGFRGQASADFSEDSDYGYGSARNLSSGTGRAFGAPNFGASSRNLDYSSSYDYGY